MDVSGELARTLLELAPDATVVVDTDGTIVFANAQVEQTFGYRAGEIDAYDVDEAIHHYYRAARELWKLCWSGGGGTHTEIIAHVVDRMATDGESINWWDRVAPLQRD